MSRTHKHETTFRAALAAAALAALASFPLPAVAQDGAGPPDEAEELRRRVREVDRLMGQAERSLARSLDTRAARERSARVAKLLDDKARKETGEGADALREQSAAGSAEDPRVWSGDSDSGQAALRICRRVSRNSAYASAHVDTT